MKKSIITASKMLIFSAFALLVQLQTYAQEKVEINGQDVGSWFSRNWMWITGGVILLVLIAVFSGGSRSHRTTTIVKDDLGNTKRVVTTDIKE